MFTAFGLVLVSLLLLPRGRQDEYDADFDLFQVDVNTVVHVSLWIITAEDRSGLCKGLSTPHDTCQRIEGHVAGASARVPG